VLRIEQFPFAFNSSEEDAIISCVLDAVNDFGLDRSLETHNSRRLKSEVRNDLAST